MRLIERSTRLTPSISGSIVMQKEVTWVRIYKAYPDLKLMV